MKGRIQCRVKLSVLTPRYYRVKRGQTVEEIARTFRLPARLLASANSLTREAEEGQVLLVPEGGNLYTVRGGESKTLLCGSPARFFTLNQTNCLYPGQTVLLG